MKRYYLACVFVISFFLLGPSPVHGASLQAYQDYVFQFDQYRSRFNEFRVALTQYQQFGSLESQQNALDRAKLAIAQRDTVGRTYLLFLNEKLGENPGIGAAELQLYRSVITNEIAFLDQHSTLVPSISSISDTEQSSLEFTKHYNTLQSVMRQAIIAVQLGYLNYFSNRFEQAAIQAQALIIAHKPQASAAKRSSLDRWLLELSNKRSLYQQKTNSIRQAAFTLTGDWMEQEKKFAAISLDLALARQYLLEGTSYLGELERALKYE